MATQPRTWRLDDINLWVRVAKHCRECRLDYVITSVRVAMQWWAWRLDDINTSVRVLTHCREWRLDYVNTSVRVTSEWRE